MFFRSAITIAFLLSSVSCKSQYSGNDIVPSLPETSAFDIQIDTLVTGFSIPWSFVWLPDGTLLVAERSGEIIPVTNGVKGDPVGNVPAVYARGQGGLLNMELHPDFENNEWIYITYSSEDGDEEGAHTKLIRARYRNNTLLDIETLYKGSPNTKKSRHFGSSIVFDKEGYLYFAIGDRGNRDVNPQDTSRDGGKIYRLYDDGSIPEDNPFKDVNGKPTAVFSYGHRNPQGLAMHPETGQIWETEHGPKGGDEVNIIQKGKNYGWPEITYGINYSGTIITKDTAKEGMEQPVIYWVPSIAPCGTVFVTGNQYPGWEGDLLVGSLKFNYLARCDVEGERIMGEEQLATGLGRVRSVRMGPDDLIYIGVEGLGIVRLTSIDKR